MSVGRWKVAVVEATVPAGASAGGTFDWLLPGAAGSVASVTVPPGAQGTGNTPLLPPIHPRAHPRNHRTEPEDQLQEKEKRKSRAREIAAEKKPVLVHYFWP